MRWAAGLQGTGPTKATACTPKNRIEFLPPPAVVEFDGYGSFSKTSMGEGERCPDTHFLCPGFYCLPVYVVCNGVYDCPGWEDEAGCDVFTCPGFYRCRHSAVCLHPRHLCDGVFQCPRHDDELLCDVSCPGGCRCQGLSAVCQHPFPVSSHRHFRFVDASGTNMSPVDFKLSLYLVSLRLARCQLRALLLSTLPNLQQLDLSDNLIGTVDVAVLVKVANLRQLRLSGNRISSITAGDISSKHWNFHLLDLSRNAIREFDSRPLSEFQSFRILNLTSNPVRTISEAGMRGVMRLEVLDLRHSPLETFPGDVFQGLTRLKKVYADNYKLCCRATLPEHLPAGRLPGTRGRDLIVQGPAPLQRVPGLPLALRCHGRCGQRGQRHLEALAPQGRQGFQFQRLRRAAERIGFPDGGLPRHHRSR